MDVFYDVLRAESRALDLLKSSFQPSIEAIALLKEMAGRLLVSGMGKSGLVAQKVASTFTSLGTPAVFLDPAGASHGDLGQLQGTDVLMIFSKSGETEELVSVVGRAREIGIPILIVTMDAKAFLSQCSTLVFELPTIDEACVHGLAPTTSTVMMMAIGDGLAVAVSYSNSFTREEFFNLHPGGALGRFLYGDR